METILDIAVIGIGDMTEMTPDRLEYNMTRSVLDLLEHNTEAWFQNSSAVTAGIKKLTTAELDYGFPAQNIIELGRFISFMTKGLEITEQWIKATVDREKAVVTIKELISSVCRLRAAEEEMYEYGFSDQSLVDSYRDVERLLIDTADQLLCDPLDLDIITAASEYTNLEQAADTKDSF